MLLRIQVRGKQALDGGNSLLERPAAVVAEGNIHENAAAFGLKHMMTASMSSLFLPPWSAVSMVGG